MAERNGQAKTLAKIMAEFVFGLRYEAIPAEVVTAARRHLADALACALGARRAPAVRTLKTYAIGKGGPADATILGGEKKVPAGLAALVNGTMVRYLDANDIFVLSRGGPTGHCSDGTAALLALAEKHRRSGEELLTCLVASYELQGALLESYNFWTRGLHALSSVAWAAPIVAARLAGATPQEAAHACGLSLATSSVLNTWLRPAHIIPMIKGAAVGLVLERAVEAVELAALGATATEDALETAVSRLAPSEDAGIVAARLAQLGARWTTTANMIKFYPAQLYTQAAVEAAVGLYRRGARADGVRKLTLYGHRGVCGGVQGSAEAYAPASREAADHSAPYVIAMALLRGRLTSREYDGAPWETSEVKNLMAKIELVLDPDLDKAFQTEGILGVRLAARLADGRTEEIVVRQPNGHPDRPLGDAELLEKMTWLANDSGRPDPARRLLNLCKRLKSSEDIEKLIEACHLRPSQRSGDCV